jgi:hypothetical protein
VGGLHLTQSDVGAVIIQSTRGCESDEAVGLRFDPVPCCAEQGAQRVRER